MIVTRLEGGLGNQLFQYALGRNVAVQHNQPLSLDISRYHDTVVTATTRAYRLHHFAVEATPATDADLKPFTDTALTARLKRRLGAVIGWAGGYTTIHEKRNFTYDPHLFDQQGHLRLLGFWQHSAYLRPVEAQLRHELVVTTAPDERNRAALAEIAAAPAATALHIRRGDYVSDLEAAASRGMLLPDYYQRAAADLLSQHPDAHFFVFSDDPVWAAQNLHLPAPTRYFDHNDPDHEYEDLRLMQRCQHHIIANSTFSWWGAWLAATPSQRVYAPATWFARGVMTRDWSPPGWFLLPTD